MQIKLLHRISGCPRAKAANRMWPRRRGGLLACVVAMAFLCSAAQSGQNAPSPRGKKTPNSAEPIGQVAASGPAADKTPEVRDGPADVEKPAAADPSAREKQLAADKAELLRLAVELKKEIAKSGTSTLSLTVIRKAAEIEKLAHSVKQEMNRNLKPAS